MNGSGQVGEAFVREFVILFGFMNGVFIAVGMNPQAEIFSALRTIVELVNPGSDFGLFFFLIQAIIFLGAFAAMFALGGWLGLVAVGLAFLGGLAVVSFGTLGGLLLVAGVILGFFAAS